MSYEASLKQKRDWENVLSTAVRQGIDTGLARERARADAEKRAIVRSLINQTAFSDAEIAGIAEVTMSLAAEVRTELDK